MQEIEYRWFADAESLFKYVQYSWFLSLYGFLSQLNNVHVWDSKVKQELNHKFLQSNIHHRDDGWF